MNSFCEALICLLVGFFDSMNLLLKCQIMLFVPRVRSSFIASMQTEINPTIGTDHSLLGAASTVPGASFDPVDFNLFLLFVKLQSALIINTQELSCVRLTESYAEENRLIKKGREIYVNILNRSNILA